MLVQNLGQVSTWAMVSTETDALGLLVAMLVLFDKVSQWLTRWKALQDPQDKSKGKEREQGRAKMEEAKGR